MGVREISYESFPGSGELHKEKAGYRIVCSLDQPRSPPTLYGRARASARDTGAHRKECAPRRGQCGARLRHACGRVPAADISVRGSTSCCTHAQDVADLAQTFGTSITATAIRCAQFRSICILG